MNPTSSGTEPERAATPRDSVSESGRAHGLRACALLAVLALMALRAPELLLQPRFWAEEGSVYFMYAGQHSVWEGLTFIFPTVGYFLLSLNLPCVLAAKLVPLEHAPAVTTGFALIVQLIPFVFVIWGRAALWSSPRAKALACLALLLIYNTSFIWLTSTNLHSWFGLITFCILVESSGKLSRGVYAACLCLLAFGCLSGPYSLFLYPLFFIGFLRDRQRAKLGLVVVMTAVGALQAWVVAGSVDRSNEWRKSPTEMTLELPSSGALAYHVVQPILHHSAAKELYRRYRSDDDKPSVPASLLLPLALLLLAPWRKEWSAWWPLLAFLIVSSLTTTFSMHFRPWGRYAALPGLLFLLVALGAVEPWSDRRLRNLRSLLAMGLLTLSIAIGALRYREHKDFRYTERSAVWTEELELWRADPKYKPRIWPANWVVDGLRPPD